MMKPVAFVEIPGAEPGTFGAVHYATQGYSQTTVYHQEHATALNQRQGISPEVAEAFMMGSLFGWHVPAAKPAHDFMKAKHGASIS